MAAVILLDGKFVLVRHRFGRHSYHLLPGGGVEPGETASDALRREVSEETGLTVDVLRPLFVSDTISPDRKRHVVNLTFLAKVVAGDITESPQDPRVEGVDLVEPHRLANLDLRPPIAANLLDAFNAGFAGEARYLGSLWVEDPQ